MKKFGWIPNKKDDRDYDYIDFGYGNFNYKSFNVLDIPEIKNQGGDPSCVGQAWAGALRVQEFNNRQQLIHGSYELSANFAYYMARLEALRFKSLSRIIMRNKGTSLRAGAKGIVTSGISSESRWPSISKTINRQPSWDAMALCDDKSGGSYYVLKSKELPLVDEVMMAINNKQPPVTGAFISSSFCNDHGPEIIDKPPITETIVAGHAFFIAGYRCIEGKLQFLLVNSWDKKWRNKGTVWVTEEFLSICVDFMVMTNWRNIR